MGFGGDIGGEYEEREEEDGVDSRIRDWKSNGEGPGGKGTLCCRIMKARDFF